MRRRRQVRAIALGVAGTLGGVGLLAAAFVLLSATPERRMDRFVEAPAAARDDLLYLSYIDSLARADRAVPAGLDASRPLAAQLAARAGVAPPTLSSWGLGADAGAEPATPSELFRQLNRHGRIILPLYGEALWTHLRERRLHPGYLVFGQTPAAAPDEADLCALLTATNSIQPEFSALIYRDPATGRFVHGKFGDMPQFAYLGGAILGDDIPAVYRRYFQFHDARNSRPLY